MGRGKRDVRPLFLKIGLALACSIGGILYTFIRNKKIKPSQFPHDPLKSQDCNNQVNSGSENRSQFDPLAADKQFQDDLHNSTPDLSPFPSSRSNTDKDTYLLPEFNDLVKEFDTAAIKTSTELHEQEIKRLRSLVKTLKERESRLEIQLLEYYGLEEQQTAVFELQNRLKSNAVKIESLKRDNTRLEAQVGDYSKVVSDLEAARSEVKVLKRRLRSEVALNKDRILDLQERVRKMQEDEEKGGGGADSETRLRVCKLKDLEAEVAELKKSNYSLRVEKSELVQRLESVQMLATSVLEDKETEKLKEESRHLKKQNEDLTNEIEQLQADRCTDVEELVYLRWINACLRYELRNHQPGPGKTTARDLGKTPSPKSEEKAKQLILEYAKKEGGPEMGLDLREPDSDQWSSSQASNLTDDLDESSFIDDSSSRKNESKFIGKLMKMLKGKDNHRSRTESMDYSRRLMRRHSDVYSYDKRVVSIEEGESRKSELVKYAKVLKDSDSSSSSTVKFRRRSVRFGSF